MPTTEPAQSQKENTSDEHIKGKLTITIGPAKSPVQLKPRRQYTLLELLGVIKSAIWHKRPVLGVIMAKHGKRILHQYTQDFLDVNASERLDARKNELIAMISELLKPRLGEKVAHEVENQLHKKALVSTTDHHATIDHPFFVNANIISAIPYLNNPETDLRHLVVLSFASVSLNNASAYPRGIEFHGGVNGSGNMIRLPLLPDKIKMGVVHGTRAFTAEDLKRAENDLLNKEKKGDITPERSEKIRQILREYFGRPEVLSAPDLNTQITIINFHLWPKFFHSSKPDTKPVPGLIYLEIETLVSKLLIAHHFKNPSSVLYKLLFDPAYQSLAHHHFNNLHGAFSLENKTGTYLFWGMDEKKYRVQLELRDGKLMDDKGKISIPCTPEAVERALEEKVIFPSMITCYLMVSLYYGMKCLGGFCQVHDLTTIKTAWGELLKTAGETDEAEAISPVQTKELGGDGMVLAYLKTSKNEIVPATGLDLMLDPGDTCFECYAEFSKKVTLQEMMNPMLPEMYTVLYPIHERESKLTSLSPEQIVKITGLQKQLKKDMP